MQSRRNLLQLLLVGCAGVALTGMPAVAKTFEVTRTDAEWRKLLSPAEYNILRGALDEPAAQGTSQGRIPVPRLRPAAVCVIDQVRQRHGLAEFLAAAAECDRIHHRQQLDRITHRSALPSLRRPSWACI